MKRRQKKKLESISKSELTIQPINDDAKYKVEVYFQNGDPLVVTYNPNSKLKPSKSSVIQDSLQKDEELQPNQSLADIIELNSSSCLKAQESRENNKNSQIVESAENFHNSEDSNNAQNYDNIHSNTDNNEEIGRIPVQDDQIVRQFAEADLPKPWPLWIKALLGSGIVLLLILSIGLGIYFSIPKGIKPEFILKRSYSESKAQQFNVTVFNKMKAGNSTDQIMRINYTFIVVVNKNRALQIDFLCSIQKRSEERISQNGTVEQTQMFDESNTFLDILKNGAVDSSGDDSIIDSDDYQSVEGDYDTSNLPQNETIKFVKPSLPIFRFTLKNDGKLLNITFPKQTQKQLLGFLKGLIKMYSPLLKTEIYQSPEPSKVQKRNGLSVSSDQNDNNTNNDDQSSPSDLLYSQSNSYDHNKGQNGETVLKNSGEVNSNGPSHNTKELTAQQNSFDQNGQLLNTKANSDTLFSSPVEQPDGNSSTVNFDLSITSSQTAELNLSSSFVTIREYIDQYQGLIKSYEQKNQTITFSTEQLVNYILNNTNDEKGNPGESRLLFESDGSITLVKFGKEIKILNTVFLGCKIGVYGVARINIYLRQDPENQYLKYPVVNAQVGSIFVIGFLKLQNNLLDYQKYFQPLSLKFTLDQIESVFDFFKGSFIEEIESLTKLILSGDFDQHFLPAILDTTSSIMNIQNTLLDQMNINSPIQTLNKVYQIVTTIESIIQTKGQSLFDPRGQLIANLSIKLLAYVNVSYADALQIFSQVKQNLTNIKKNGKLFLSNTLDMFSDSDMFKIGNIIKELIPEDVYNQYKEEMEKAKEIIKFIKYVMQNGLQYKDTLFNILDDHQSNFMKLAKNTIDMYFSNQSLTTNPSKSLFEESFEKLKNQITDFNQSLSNNLQKVKNKSQNLLNTILFQRFIDSYYSKGYTANIDRISQILGGIAGEAGECCHYKRTWYGRKYCAGYNDARFQQRAEPQRFGAFNQQTSGQFYSLAQQTQSLVQSIKSITNSPRGYVEKYEQIVLLKEQLVSDNDNKIDNVILKITQRRNHMAANRGRVGCGGTGNLDTYLVHLNNMLDIATELKTVFQQFSQNFTNVINSFSPEAYTSLVNNSVIIKNASDFYNQKENLKNITVNHFVQLQDIALNYQSIQFVSTPKIINNISSLYNLIRDDYSVPCSNANLQSSRIKNIRQQYENMLAKVQNVSNELFKDELDSLTANLKSAGSFFFQTYQEISFCKMHQFFNQSMTLLEPDLDNLKIFVRLFSRLSEIKSAAYDKIKSQFATIYSLQNNFFKLFTPEGYRLFINSTTSITSTLRTVIFNTSQALSVLKQQSKSLSILQMAGADLIQEAISIFVNSSFVLDYTTMFENIEGMRSMAESVIDKLSYEVIAVVVQGKEIIDHYGSSIQKYKLGLSDLRGQFEGITQGFLNLEASTTQDTLNNLAAKFQRMQNTLNTTLFGTFFDDVEFITNKYVSLSFQNQQLKRIHLNSLSALYNFSQIVGEAKEKVYSMMKGYSIKSLIDKIEIGSLNSLFQLGSSLHKQFISSYDTIKQVIKEVLNFKNLVGKDFLNLFKFPFILKSIEAKIQKQYDRSLTAINSRIKETREYLDKNSKFYLKFKQSSVHQQLEELSDKLFVKFQDIWETTKEPLKQISDLINTISQDVSGVMNELNEAKLQIESVVASIKGRVDSIKSEFKTIKSKLFNLKSLIFTTIKGDLGNVVKTSMNNIINQTDSIVDVDLNVLSQLSGKVAGGKLAIIQQTLDKAIIGYGSVKSIRTSFIQNINKGFKSIEQFLKKQLSTKMQSLKEGMMFIRAFTNLADPSQSYRIYQKQWMERIPIFSYRQMVPTIIGVFIIGFEINYSVGMKAIIDLSYFRNIDVGLVFISMFQLEASFSYGLPYILEFGLYIRGTVLRGELSPKFQLVNIIPIQLVKAIANVPEMYSSNVAKLNFVTDLTIYSVSVQIGFFIKYIWIELIWLRIKFCINFGFFKLCINFRIPIGFKFIFKRNNFGYSFATDPLANKRILNLQIATFKM